MYKTIDLCAGIGGIRQGFWRTGHFENVLSAEIDEYAARTYESLFKENPRNDLTSEEFKEVVAQCDYDVLLAGFPCQPFSSQGNLEGFGDLTKGTIFFHITQIIERRRPKVVFLENVQNIVSHDKKRTIKVIVDTLEKRLNYKVIGVSHEDDGVLKYNKDSFVRNTKDFGLPQNRPRAYFIAFDRDLYGELLDSDEFINELPRGLNTHLLNNPNLNKYLNDILDHDVDLHYYMSAKYLETLEKHEKRQKDNGNGYGYYILNSLDHHRTYANRAKLDTYILVAKCENAGSLYKTTAETPDRDNVKRDVKKYINTGYNYAKVPLPELPQKIPYMTVNLKSIERLQLSQIALDEKEADGKDYYRVASLSSPFRENVVWAHMINSCRPGMPDRDVDAWVDSIVE